MPLPVTAFRLDDQILIIGPFSFNKRLSVLETKMTRNFLISDRNYFQDTLGRCHRENLEIYLAKYFGIFTTLSNQTFHRIRNTTNASRVKLFSRNGGEIFFM